MSIINALTVDVEDYFHVAAFADSIDRNDWENLPSRVEKNTDRLLEIFDAAEVRATFFVLGHVATRFPGIVRRISDSGHEVACHGMSHRLIYRQTPKEFREETESSKSLLEDLVGSPVYGYRAASYSITPDSQWAIDIIAEAGFRYDSSIVPVKHDLYGMPNARKEPHVLIAANGARLIEFPPTTRSVLGRTVPVGGGGYFRLYPYALTRHFLRSVNVTEQRPFIFYLHPWEIDPDQPRIRAGLKSTFRHYVNLHRTEDRLRRLIADFHFDSVSRVIDELDLVECNGSA